METRTNLDKWLYLVRRIEEHREEKAVKELQKLYKKLIKDLRGKMGNLYADYADPETGKLTYEALHRQGLDARLLEEVVANVASVTADESRIIRETVEQTYANCYSGMVQAVQNAVNNEELHEAFAAVEAVKPEVIRAAVNNPVHGLTLSDQLEKNRADIIWGIKQAVGVGLSEGDNYSTMARRIQKELIGRDGSGGSYYKSIRIARTEAHRVREEGNLDAAQNLTEKLEPAGITMMKTWHTMKDERVRPSRSRKTKGGWKYSKSGKYDHQKMEGVQVPIKEDFELPSGAKTQAPGKSGVAGEDINCRCFLSYDVVKQIQQMALRPLEGFEPPPRIDWPESSGRVISEDELKQVKAYARSKGIELNGFKSFDGELQTVYDLIDDADSIAKRYPEIKTGKRRLMIELSPMQNQVFAETQGHVIKINQDAFRSTAKLEEEYEKLLKENYFPAGTTYRALIKHEVGHVIDNHYSEIRPIEIAKEIIGTDSSTEVIQYVKRHLSTYAAEKKNGVEIIAEAYAAVYGSEHPCEFALKFVEKCDKIISREVFI